MGLMCSPFLERSVSLIEYLKREGGWTHADVRSLVEEVAVRCLEIECKGKTLRKLSEIYPTVRVKIVQAVLGDHQMRVEDLPECDGEAWYRAKLGRPMSGFGARDDSSDEQSGSDDSLDESDSDDDSDGRDSSCSGEWGRVDGEEDSDVDMEEGKRSSAELVRYKGGVSRCKLCLTSLAFFVGHDRARAVDPDDPTGRASWTGPPSYVLCEHLRAGYEQFPPPAWCVSGRSRAARHAPKLTCAL